MHDDLDLSSRYHSRNGILFDCYHNLDFGKMGMHIALGVHGASLKTPLSKGPHSTHFPSSSGVHDACQCHRWARKQPVDSDCRDRQRNIAVADVAEDMYDNDALGGLYHQDTLGCCGRMVGCSRRRIHCRRCLYPGCTRLCRSNHFWNRSLNESAYCLQMQLASVWSIRVKSDGFELTLGRLMKRYKKA